MQAENCHATQLIGQDGELNVSGLESFTTATNFAECGRAYSIVSITGPQHGGKSTLLNRLFGTKFQEMNALRGRAKTTYGVWIAKSTALEPVTIVMDLEGTDGRERAEDDTAFDKRSALFALATSDIVLVNMWCHDVGLEQAANKPLLRTVFQVMLNTFSPRKTTLLFVLRDKTKTPLHYLEPILREDIQKIWDEIAKPHAHRNTPLGEFFNVEVTALSNYEAEEELFNKEVDQLRRRFFSSNYTGGFVGDRQGVVPASGFSFSIQQIWQTIKENKELDIPAHKLMVANVHCEEIAYTMLYRLTTDKDWLELNADVHAGLVSNFSQKFLSIMANYLSEYDKETMYFDEGIRREKRQQLQSRALDLAHPAYVRLVEHLRSNALERFKTRLEQSPIQEGFAAYVHTCVQSCMDEFDQGCADANTEQATWDASQVRENLDRDIEEHALSVCNDKLEEITARSKEEVTRKLSDPVESLLESGDERTWPCVRQLVEQETSRAASELLAAIACFELDNDTINTMVQNLKNYARNIIEEKSREEAKKVLFRMKDRFSRTFNLDEDSLPRIWTGKEDINKITKQARSASLKLLSVMAAIRLDEKPDKVQKTLISSLLDRTATPTIDPLASTTWEEVPPNDMMITPVECKRLWSKFKDETEYIITQAILVQKASKWRKSLDMAQSVAAIFATAAVTVISSLSN